MKVLFCLGLLQLVLSDIQATFTANTTVACPKETVVFTCAQPGTSLVWTVTLGNVMDRLDLAVGVTTLSRTDVNPNFVFEGVLTVNGTSVISILTTITDISLLNGTMVTCQGQGGLEGPLSITVAGSPTPLINSIVTSSQDGPSSSTITIQWEHSTPGGVSVHYILSISPTPLSGSPVTVETTSVVITVEYNRPYNVTIRAENCAGISEVVLPVDPIVPCPSNPSTATGVVIISPPSVPTVGSMLVFTCIDSSALETSTCGSDGRWSPDPENYVCPTIAPPVVCSIPSPPVNGIILNGTSGPSPVDTVVYYKCVNGLFPAGNLSSTCDSDGIWDPINPQDQLCSPEPFTCSVPEAPTNGFVVQTSNTTIVFGCNEGFSPQQNRTANCTDTNQWSSLPEDMLCMIVTVPTASPIGPIVGGVVGGLLFLIVLIVIIIIVLLVVSSKRAKYTVPAGPVYDEVSPAPNQQIELNTNSAYGPVTPGPVYEDVKPEEIEPSANNATPDLKEEIELKTNDAYNQVKRC